MLVKFRLNALTAAEVQDAAQELYQEEEAKLQRDLRHLSTWAQQCPHLASIRRDEVGYRRHGVMLPSMMIQVSMKFFLRGCGHSLERTKARLELFFSVKTNLPAWFDGWDTENPELRGLETRLCG